MPRSFHDHEGFVITSGAWLGSVGAMCSEGQQHWALHIPTADLALGTDASAGNGTREEHPRKQRRHLTPGKKSQGISVTRFSRSVVPDSVQPPGLQPTRLLCPWDSPGKDTGVGCCALLQGIFPTQGSNPGLLLCRQILDLLSHSQGQVVP